MTIPDICPGHGEANRTMQGRTPEQQRNNEEAACIIAAAIVCLIVIGVLCWLVGVMP